MFLQIPPITISPEIISRVIETAALAILGYAGKRKLEDILTAIDKRAVNAASEAIKPTESKLAALQIWCDQHEVRDQQRHMELLTAVGKNHGG